MMSRSIVLKGHYIVLFTPIPETNPKFHSERLRMSEVWKITGWFPQVDIGDLSHLFDGWTYDWLDVPDLINGANVIYEILMIDRDPVKTWIDGPITLIEDAAHAMLLTDSDAAISTPHSGARTVGVRDRANLDVRVGFRTYPAQPRFRTLRPVEHGQRPLRRQSTPSTREGRFRDQMNSCCWIYTRRIEQRPDDNCTVCHAVVRTINSASSTRC